MLQKTSLKKLLPIGAVVLALLVGIGFGWQARKPSEVAVNDSLNDATEAQTEQSAGIDKANSSDTKDNVEKSDSADKSATVVSSTGNAVNTAGTQDDASVLAMAESAYASGDLTKVVSLLTPLAESGNAVAQHRLGFMYSTGTGVEQNDAKAIEWFEKAVANNDEESRVALSELLNKQLTANLDTSAQIPMLEKLSAMGDVNANAVLGSYLLTGTGIEADPFRALPLLRAAAEQGDSRAMTNLGYAYGTGVGVSQNNQKAFQWYLQAAELGVVRAQVVVAAMLEHGQGTEPDEPESIRWYLNAASAGNDAALQRVGELMLEGKVQAPDDEESAAIILNLAQRGNDDAVQWLREQSEASNDDAKAAYAHILLSSDTPNFDANAGMPLLIQAAEAGISNAQLLLAKQYASGEHISLEPVRAYAWANLAAAEGNAEAVTIRDAMVALLTPSELQDGQALSSELFDARKQKFELAPAD